jgi:tRNA pseudouridine38-40 synthase
LGLLLESPVYDVYNGDRKTANEKLPPDHADIRPQIDFAKLADKMETFKQEYIYSSMRGIEGKTGL